MRFRCFRTVAFCLAVWGRATAQQPNETQFKLSVSVQEVSLAFSAFDAHGQGIDNLTKADLLLEDDRTRQNIESLTYYRDLPIHAGFLFDTSISMMSDLRHNAEIAQLYAAQILERGKDQAFVAGFDTRLTITQGWTDDPAAIDSGIQKLSRVSENGASATAIFDSLYRSCRDRWPVTRGPVTGNFIMLFTDGIDDASHAELGDAIEMCQRSRTAIYIFTNQRNARGSSQGGKTLASLVAQSGGRIYFNPRETDLAADVLQIEKDQRNLYQLIYKPTALEHDGKFYTVQLRSTIPKIKLLTRSGYYAPPPP
jgi:Ca-activated chloride channel family protein